MVYLKHKKVDGQDDATFEDEINNLSSNLWKLFRVFLISHAVVNKLHSQK